MPHMIHAKGGAALKNFDFAVIRYAFAGADGRDLDTRTALMEADPSVNGRDLGWCQDGSRYGDFGGGDGAVIGVDFTDYFLFWGGDNTGTGVEACLVDFPRLTAAFPSLAQIKVRMRANWYGERYTGNCQLQFETYLGGAMSRDGYDFVNTGGVLVDSLSVPRNVVSNVADDVDGDDLGFLVYTVATKEGTITDP